MTEQEKIKDALISIGFEQPFENFPHIFRYKGFDVKVSQHKTLGNVFEDLIIVGQQLKTWEVQKALGI